MEDVVSDMTANQEDVATGEKNVDVSISNSYQRLGQMVT